ncbi:hypothetical protein NDU88_007087 [Pleurodeles waltl]|uniref:Uncharacterized protein n=1 Tax=Pleurodeles waltl TaxID=8319 RepID=A0AAV7LRI4_PLEWA|nr:hypothetical protein NDU88_007087 [Pleurodeles waltl]
MTNRAVYCKGECMAETSPTVGVAGRETTGSCKEWSTAKLLKNCKRSMPKVSAGSQDDCRKVAQYGSHLKESMANMQHGCNRRMAAEGTVGCKAHISINRKKSRLNHDG